MFIKKRDGREVEFDSSKIVTTIRKANAECEIHSQISNARINAIAEDVKDLIANRIFISGEEITVEDIQDAVEKTLFEYGGLCRRQEVYDLSFWACIITSGFL